MASAEARLRTEVVGVTLELTFGEAKYLMALTGSVGGLGELRRTNNDIWQVLNDVLDANYLLVNQSGALSVDYETEIEVSG